MGIEHLTVLFATEVSSFDFQVECTDRTVQHKLNAQSLRLFGLHRDVNDTHRAGANRLQNKQNVHTVLASLPATLLRVNPELYQTKFGTRAQQQGASVHVGQQDVEDASWTSCSRAEQASPAPQQTTVPKPMRSMSLKTPPSSPRANRSELQKAARPSQSFREANLLAARRTQMTLAILNRRAASVG